jgi:hypothetical protein
MLVGIPAVHNLFVECSDFDPQQRPRFQEIAAALAEDAGVRV